MSTYFRTAGWLTFATVLLAALGLAPGFAHLLEMPIKLQYAPQLYQQVTSTLYAWFGIVGGAVQVAAIASVFLLMARRRRSPHLASGFAMRVALVALLASLLAWGAFVAPVNARWASATAARDVDLPALYAQLRVRWEYGHLVAHALWFVGFCALLRGVLPARDR